MRKKKNGEYEVNFGKPPRHTRFKPGRSGNPKGRPRQSKNVATLVHEALYEQVEVSENGRRKRISKLEAGFKQFANRIARGDPRAIQTLLAIPGVQRQLVELKTSRPLTPEAWEHITTLVRGDLSPEGDGGPTNSRVRRRQPDIGEVANRLKEAIRNRR